MENALFVNNKIIVNKLAYGPKLPMSLEDIPWINVISKVTRNKKIDYIRLGGLSKIKRNDIIVFKMPINNKKNLVKRCIGLPGEKITILQDSILINNHLIEQASTIKNLYNIYWSKNQNQLFKASVKLGFKIIKKRDRGSLFLQANLNGYQKKQLSLIKSTNDSLCLEKRWLPYYQWNKDLAWNGLHIDSLIIPKKGLKIKWNSRNRMIYLTLIRRFEAINNIQLLEKSILKEYTFTKDYYFFLGDNRFFSEDSRFWGLVPEESIEGKVMKVL